MFHNVLMTTLTPIRDTNEVHCWNRPFTTIGTEITQEKVKDTNIKKTIKKKKRNRTMFTTEQVRTLEKVFARSKYIDVERRREISECLQVNQKCIKIWFQNRRMKEKKELTESCDSTSESQVSSVESASPPLELSHSPNNESDVDYKLPHVPSHVRHPQYYNDAPNNYFKTEVHQNEPSCYDMSNNPIMHGYFHYNNSNFNSNSLGNNTDYMAQYYPRQAEFQYYYNNSEINNQSIAADVRDWPTNIF